MTDRYVCFSHGKESGPWGTKITALADIARRAGWSVESLDYRGMDDPGARVEHLLRWCNAQTAPYVLAGSSMGGHVALAAAARARPCGVFLMAPALYVPGYEGFTPVPPDCPVAIVHGWDDNVIPWQGVVRFAAESRATTLLLAADHGLVEVIEAVGARFQTFLDSLSI
jgi:alpha-beta hydrolase superfamily lysophospholipase